jgi:hypothetical protein
MSNTAIIASDCSWLRSRRAAWWNLFGLGFAEVGSAGSSSSTAPASAGTTPGSARCRLVAEGRFVLVNDVAGQAAVFGNGEALLFGPGAYLTAALPAGCGSDRAPRPQPNRPGVLDEPRQLPAEFGCVSGVEVDRVDLPVYAELDGLIGRAARQIVFQLYFDPLHCLPPSCSLPWCAQVRD